jgi:hypothetical protein
MQIYQGNFTCWEDVQHEFQMSEPETGKVVLLAAYETPDYDGYATVVYFEAGKFHVVEASHCSCYGLEGQFAPEETPLEALLHRAENGHFYCVDGKALADLLRGIADDIAA